jgi:dissimilatory sulfite reductase (desulfoviridin) alpha/beta subunit
MATALTEKTRAGQVGNHTVSSAIPHESTCNRCGGLMVQDFCLDVLGSIGESEFAAKRCVQCGEVVDPVILRNRGTRQEPMTVQLAGKMLRNNCVMGSR